ncbi:dihydroxyacetone kinase subunit DhaL [Acidocella sp.]|uniref:dihydroxyacetone kinase subunit DhaL n=1 Tax=Acidocella sp. TaxID=50710 RepID=UPI002612DD2B|nr:dihydroxyacetone kinase subunit DhaL [Acidocella sp.]
MSELLDVPVLSSWLKRADELIAARQAYLSDLDAAIGDGDHGANLVRGFHAVNAKLGTPADPAALFKTVGMTLIGTVGGASGPLYGSMFVEMGKAAAGKPTLDVAAWAEVLAAGVNGIAMRGKALPGEKTMLDALTPAVAAARAAATLPAALGAAAEAARQGAEATVPMVARKGRASYLGERSAGHADPGATSAALLLAALAEAAA